MGMPLRGAPVQTRGGTKEPAWRWGWQADGRGWAAGRFPTLFLTTWSRTHPPPNSPPTHTPQFGEVDIDSDLVSVREELANGEEQIMMLNNGCLCCTVRDDLVEMLNKLVRGEPGCGWGPVFLPRPVQETLAFRFVVGTQFQRRATSATGPAQRPALPAPERGDGLRVLRLRRAPAHLPAACGIGACAGIRSAPSHASPPVESIAVGASGGL